MSNKRKCCCGPQDCPEGNCPTIDADCASKGLQPFTLYVAANVSPSTCNSFSYDILDCNPPQCTEWITIPDVYEGCLPCDEEIDCGPCQSQTPWTPYAGYQFPVRSCNASDPRKTAERCELPHVGYWTTIQTSPEECAPLGSVTCVDAVYVPAGTISANYISMGGEITIVHGQFNNCVNGNPMTLPQTGGPVWGWPCDCGTNPACIGCPCSCGCSAIWPTYDMNPPGWDPTDGTFEMNVIWVAPCGGSRPGQSPEQRATFNCGGGCDCDGSYIAIRFSASFVAKIGFDEPIPAGDALFPMTGAAGDGGAGTICDSYIATEPGPQCGQFFSATPISEYTCNIVRIWEVVFRRKMDITQLPPANLCAMLPGEYEPVGIVICNHGPTGPAVCCDVTVDDCSNADVCWQDLDACESSAQWRDYLWKNGLQNIRVIIQ